MQNAICTYNYITLIPYINFDLWDTKRYTSKGVMFSSNIVELDFCIKVENKKYKLNEDEETEFGILGVNNKKGIFDAYLQKGEKINQSYKKMEVGWLAYNPFRINVGSIGIRLKEHKNEYISPAYIVFSCKENILPEYLFLVLKTKTFNKVINENTTGSVRQKLTIDILKKLKILLPPLTEQQKIIDTYQAKIQQIQALQTQVYNLENEIKEYILEQFGIENYILEQSVIEKSENRIFNKELRFISFEIIEKWSLDFIVPKINSKGKFKKYKISDLCKISRGGTPNRSIKNYYNNGTIPWIKNGELLNNIIFKTEECITEYGLKNSSAKIYPKGSIAIAMYGVTIGKTAKFGIDSSTNQACAVLYNINNSLVETDYLWEFLQSQTQNFKKIAYGSTQPKLNAGIISNYEVPISPLKIQQKIVECILLNRKKITDLQKKIIDLQKKFEQEFETKY